MFSEGFRHFPKKLLTHGPLASWLYCYLMSKMDDRGEMVCKFNISEAMIEDDNGFTPSRTTIKRRMKLLCTLGLITYESGESGYIVKPTRYPNYKGFSCGPPVAHLVAHLEAHIENKKASDIFDEIECSDYTGGPPRGPLKNEGVAHLGGVLVRRDKEIKNTIADDMLTPVSLAPQQAESPIPKRRKSTKPKVPPKSGLLFQTYSEEFLAAYACKALRWDAGENSAACRLIDDVGEQEAIEMLRQFFKCKEKGLVDNKHPIKFFFGRKQKYHAQISEPVKKQELTDFSRRSL